MYKCFRLYDISKIIYSFSQEELNKKQYQGRYLWEIYFCCLETVLQTFLLNIRQKLGFESDMAPAIDVQYIQSVINGRVKVSRANLDQMYYTQPFYQFQYNPFQTRKNNNDVLDKVQNEKFTGTVAHYCQNHQIFALT